MFQIKLKLVVKLDRHIKYRARFDVTDNGFIYSDLCNVFSRYI